MLVAIDSGTTSCRTLAFDEWGNAVALAQEEFPQYYPQPGWVEHDARVIWETQKRTLDAVLAQVGRENVRAIGITNQRETVVVWDRATGEPVASAIVWQCRRTTDDCQRLKADGIEPWIRAKTGLLLDPYFSGTKLAWLLTHTPQLRARAERGEVLFGTIDAWLLWKLTDGRVHATDPSNASRTLLVNLATRRWDDELLALFDIPPAMLPEIRPSGGAFGDYDGIPITAILGDQQAALFGQACFSEGDTKCTYGTGCFLLTNAGSTPPIPNDGLLATVGWERANEVVYALEGAVFIAGAAVQWLRDGLGVIAAATETEALAQSVPDTGGVYFVPAFTGLGAPHWNPDARGLICGLTRGTTRAHLVRATLEAIAYQNRSVLDHMGGGRRLRVDGGATANNFLMQFQADILGKPVERPAQTETTALGVALLAGLSVGLWESTDALAALWRSDRTFMPALPGFQREKLWLGWQRAVGLQVEGMLPHP